jgi:isopenicillin-N epimerase
MPDSEPTEPAFGHAILGEWMLDENIVYLNHGSYGAAPRRVLAAQQRWRDALERDPARFVRDELPEALDAARRALSGYLGADLNNLAYVDNATTGINAVVASLDLGSGDEVVTTSHAYSAVRKTLAYHCGRRGAQLIEVPLRFPPPDEDAVIGAVEAALSDRTRLAVLDHVTSDSALVFPLERLADLCRERGVPLLVDGAHAAGMLPLDLERLAVDWYAGNAHKWLCAPKGAAFFWARADRQADIHPPVISRGFGQGFLAEFNWQGTRDFSAWLSLPEVVAFRAALGDSRVRAYCQDLAGRVADMLAETWDTEAGTPPAMRGFMVTARLPGAPPASPPAVAAIRRALLYRHGVEAHFVALEGVVWARVSAHVYNEIGDYARLAEALPDVLAGQPWQAEG